MPCTLCGSDSHDRSHCQWTEDDTINALRKAPFETVLAVYGREWRRPTDQGFYDLLFKPYGWTYREFLETFAAYVD
jgi:hypothetical protein